MWPFRNTHESSWRRPAVRWLLSVTILTLGLCRIGLSQSKSKTTAADEKGRKFVNKIPYDVFFDNPLEVVNSNKNSVPTTDATVQKSPEKQPEPRETTGARPAGGIDWNEMLPIDEVQREVKTLRNSLNSAMSNQGQFNNNFKEISYDGAELAALAGIVQAHGDSLSWKDKSQFVRDFSAQINQASIGLGKEHFDKTKAAFQKLTSVLDGSVPPDAGDIPATRPFSETASRKGLMRRMDRAKKWLKEDVNTESKFKTNSSQIEHEAAILAAMATIITTEGYGDRDNEDYQQFAKSLIDGAREAYNSAKDGSFEKFKPAVDKINKSCTDCHGVYGNG